MMKKEYDFSKGVRGKFYNENAQFNIPVYLEPEVESFIAKSSIRVLCYNFTKIEV